MTETNRIEFKRELTRELDLEREVVAFLNYGLPRNRELMRVFRDVEMVESLGSGMNRIMRIYGRDNFEFGDNYVRMIVPYNWIPEEGEADNGNVLENVLEKNIQLSERQKNIIQRMRETGTMNVLKNVLENVLETSASLAEYFSVSERTIRRDLQFLQKNGIIRRVGPDKGGHWEVIGNGQCTIDNEQ